MLKYEKGKSTKGTEQEHTSFAGVLAEVTVDTDKKTLRVHDGSTRVV